MCLQSQQLRAEVVGEMLRAAFQSLNTRSTAFQYVSESELELE